MIQQETLLKVIDNSGAKIVKCIKVYGGFKRRTACLGDIISISVQKLRNRFKIKSKVKKGEVFLALIVHTKNRITKKDGSLLFFKKNKICILNKTKKPLATRILGPIPKELRKKKFLKFVSVSSGFI